MNHMKRSLMNKVCEPVQHVHKLMKSIYVVMHTSRYLLDDVPCQRCVICYTFSLRHRCLLRHRVSAPSSGSSPLCAMSMESIIERQYGVCLGQVCKQRTLVRHQQMLLNQRIRWSEIAIQLIHVVETRDAPRIMR